MANPRDPRRPSPWEEEPTADLPESHGNGHDDEKTPERPFYRPQTAKARILAPFANVLLYIKDVFEKDMRRAIDEIINADHILTIGPYAAAVLTAPVDKLSDELKGACSAVIANAAREHVK